MHFVFFNDVYHMHIPVFSDISKIHDGIGDKCGSFFQWFCAFLAGFAVGFAYGWKLTLVIIAISPLLAGAAMVMTKVCLLILLLL